MLPFILQIFTYKLIVASDAQLLVYFIPWWNLYCHSSAYLSTCSLWIISGIEFGGFFPKRFSEGVTMKDTVHDYSKLLQHHCSLSVVITIVPLQWWQVSTFWCTGWKTNCTSPVACPKPIQHYSAILKHCDWSRLNNAVRGKKRKWFFLSLKRI